MSKPTRRPSSTKAQQSPEIQSSCTSVHTLLNISSLNVPCAKIHYYFQWKWWITAGLTNKPTRNKWTKKLWTKYWFKCTLFTFQYWIWTQLETFQWSDAHVGFEIHILIWFSWRFLILRCIYRSKRQFTRFRIRLMLGRWRREIHSGGTGR